MTKRKRSIEHDTTANKRQKSENNPDRRAARSVQHAVLKLYYPRLCSLGEFLKEKLPSRSRYRRKKLELFHDFFPEHRGFLDRVLVGITIGIADAAQHVRRDELTSFTQTQRVSRGSHDKGRCNLGEILDFAIWLLFRRGMTNKTPSHLLCHGFQRSTSRIPETELVPDSRLPGIVQRNENRNLSLLRESPWTDIANLLGDDAELIMLNLLLDCGIYQRLQSGKDNLYQLCGEPVSALQTRTPSLLTSAIRTPCPKSKSNLTQPSAIIFARSRMLYARAPLNGQGKVQLGLNRFHALNRYSSLPPTRRTIRMMQYLFPRQFHLHNVFTSVTTSGETTHSFKEYTSRDDEIALSEVAGSVKVPRRLRGFATTLVEKMCMNHVRCSYTQLLRNYCPLPPSTDPIPGPVDPAFSIAAADVLLTQPKQATQHTSYQPSSNLESGTSFMPFATPSDQVSAFCQAVMRKLLPRGFLGTDKIGDKNWKHLLYWVDKFVKMRRYETINLHELSQKISLTSIRWLRPCMLHATDKMSVSDRAKRLELLHELLYYIFDSLLVPLIRSNFYVTETAVHRNRLFYFRQDVWKSLSDPCLAVLKMNMFQPLKSRQMQHSFGSYSLGCSQMRLLPKEHGVRPIMNLKRRSTKMVNGKRMLGAGINTQLLPVFSVLNFERQRQPEALASAMFSIGEIRTRLKDFKMKLSESPRDRLYFIKVDIRSCFDTIPQKELLGIVKALIGAGSYQATKHVEIKRVPGFDQSEPDQIVKRYVNRALPSNKSPLFSPHNAEEAAGSKRRSIFVGTDQIREIKLAQVHRLLTEHLTQNIVRIGRRHFKQVEGIPQGSVLSSLLCSLFYGDFERKRLSFLDPNSSLLLRLIDDFLLITSDRSQAKAFVTAMSADNSEYGITINAEKSLANFEMSVNGCRVPRIQDGLRFPYCGMDINTQTLQLSKDRQHKDSNVENGLTVDESGKVGVKLQRRILTSFKLQMHSALLDKSLNPKAQVLRSLFEGFTESGMKMHRYRNSMPAAKRPSQILLVKLCTQLIDLAFKMSHRLQSHDRTLITRSQMGWLAATALSQVLKPKQSAYHRLLRWLQNMVDQSRRSMGLSNQELDDIAREGLKAFKHYVY